MGAMLQAFYWHCPKAEQKHCAVGLMSSGWLLLTATPSTDGCGAFQDPTHCSFGAFPIAFVQRLFRK